MRSSISSGPATAGGPATLMVLGSCTSLQIGAALATHLFPATGASGATLLRLGLAAGVLLAATRPGIRVWTREQWRAVILFGVALAGMNGFFYAAIARIPLGMAVTVEFLGPLALAAVLSRRARDLGWVLLALAGVAAFGWSGEAGGASAGSLDVTGVVFVLVAAVFWALYILAGARASAAVPGRGALAVAMTIAALVLTPGGLIGAERVADRPGLLCVALGTALTASVVPYSLEFAAMRRLPRRVFGVLLSLEPAVATLAGRLVLGQRVGLLGLAAIVAVVFASVGSTLAAPAPAEPAPAEPADAGDGDDESVVAAGRDPAVVARVDRRPGGHVRRVDRGVDGDVHREIGGLPDGAERGVARDVRRQPRDSAETADRRQPLARRLAPGPGIEFPAQADGADEPAERRLRKADIRLPARLGPGPERDLVQPGPGLPLPLQVDDVPAGGDTQPQHLATLGAHVPGEVECRQVRVHRVLRAATYPVADARRPLGPSDVGEGLDEHRFLDAVPALLPFGSSASRRMSSPRVSI
jgi:inner membrane transporter RhtA